MKKTIKVFIIVLLIATLIAGGFLLLLIGSFERVKTDIDQYEKDLHEIDNAAKLMPKLDSLGEYSNIEYTYKFKCYSSFMGFSSDAFALFVTYDGDQYKDRRQMALDGYEFLQAPILRSPDTYELPVTEFVYKGYTMKVIPDKEYVDFCSCKSFLLLGFNDRDQTIAYLYYYDFDIDYIAEAGDDLEKEMCDLLDRSFAWVQ